MNKKKDPEPNGDKKGLTKKVAERFRQAFKNALKFSQRGKNNNLKS
jgi:hypothetical protein